MNETSGRAELREAVGRCRWHFISAALFSAVVNLLVLAGPLFMLQVYDRVLTSRSEETLTALLVLVTGLFAMMGVLDYVRGRVLTRAGARIQGLLDLRVMTAVLRRSVDAGERARTSSAAQDLEAVRQLFAGPSPFALFDLPWTPLFLAVIFLFHPTLGWVAAGGGVVLILLALANQLRSRSPTAAAQRVGHEAEALAEALRQNAEAVQALGMREAGLGRWHKLRAAALVHQIVASDRTGSYTAFSKALRFYLQSLILACGAWLVLRHELSPGMMIGASILLGRALAPIELVIAQWGLAQRAVRGWRALGLLFETTPRQARPTTLPAPKGEMQAQGITLFGGDGAHLLRHVSFRIEPGMALGVIGPSGAGKTTLAKVLTGVWRPSVGAVRIDGAAIEQWASDDIGRHIGYLPQDIGLMSGTVAENIARMQEPRDDLAVVAAAQSAGAHQLLLSLPQGYDTQVGAGGLRLSGGQRQRVALARALYGDPPVLIFDEPNANLDVEGEQALIKTIVEAKARGRTVVVMAHRAGAIAACDLLLVLDHGVQVDFGPRDEVLGRRARIYPHLVTVPASAISSIVTSLGIKEAQG